MTDKMRQDFEAYCAIELGFTPEPDGDDRYKFHNTESMWQAWQASRATMCVELPMEYKDQFNELSYSAPAVIKAILDAGVSYK